MIPPKAQYKPDQQQLEPGVERRRSQRVMIRIPVTIHAALDEKPLKHRAHTVAVNDHGALLCCDRTFDAEFHLEVWNDQTGETMKCRVTRAPRHSPEGFLVPVEFVQPAPGFWHITFPPTDWKASGN